MKNFGKIATTLLLAGSVALTGCQAVEEDKAPAAVETSASASASPSATPITQASPAPVDFAKASPMGQDVAVLNANTATPEVYGFYTQEQFQTASTIGLNFIEQVMGVPELFASNRAVTQDGIRMQNFFTLFAPETVGIMDQMIAEKGAVNMFPFPDNDGKIPATEADGTPTFMPLKWDNKAPETKWRDVTTTGKTYENGSHAIVVSALGEHAAVDDKGESKTLTLRHTAVLYPDSTGKWGVNQYTWNLAE